MFSLSEKLKDLGIKINWSKYNQNTIQNSKLPEMLRALAVKHLRTQGKPKNIESSDWKIFLNEQSKDGVWATDTLLIGLCEALGVNLLFTVPSTEVDLCGIVLNERKELSYRAYESNDTDAPTISLYNKSSFFGLFTHWDISKTEDKTNSNGNCGYNSIAQQLLGLIKKELNIPSKNKKKELPKQHVYSNNQFPIFPLGYNFKKEDEKSIKVPLLNKL